MSGLTEEQRRALEQFARLEISLEELSRRLGSAMELDFGAAERKVTTHYGTPQPPVRVEMSHIEEATKRHACGEITTRELSQWASMLLLNEAYGWEGPDEERVADSLCELSLLGTRHRAR